MNTDKYTFVDLTPAEKNLLRANSDGISVFMKALPFEQNLICAFIADLKEEKIVARKTARIRIDEETKASTSSLRNYLLDNFSFNATTQEIYWLVCRYLFSKYPGFRGHFAN
ncbi:hypothetical protein KKI24_12505 [bacterium]|nr:hypothetical protein [bacterium]